MGDDKLSQRLKDETMATLGLLIAIGRLRAFVASGSPNSHATGDAIAGGVQLMGDASIIRNGAGQCEPPFPTRASDRTV
jgi:hypothetical protein